MSCIVVYQIYIYSIILCNENIYIIADNMKYVGTPWDENVFCVINNNNKIFQSSESSIRIN